MDTNILSKIAKEPETRTTCTLSQEGNSALDSLMKIYGLTQKQAFDLFISKDGVSEDILSFATSPENSSLQREVRKSLVITKKNLKLLNEAAEKAGVSRDVLIDSAFRCLLKHLVDAFKQQNEKHKKALLILKDAWGYLEKKEKELQELLDEDDDILSRFGEVIVVQMNLAGDVEKSLVK